MIEIVYNRRLCGVITENESWFYLIQIRDKSSKFSWDAEGESPRTMMRRYPA